MGRGATCAPWVTAMGDFRGRVPDLDLDLLRCFVHVAERGGFTAAAPALGLTQSAISLKIRRLSRS